MLAQLSKHFLKKSCETGIKLRDYQQKCIANCLQSFKDGQHKIAVSLGTGGGKTVIFAHLADLLEPNAQGGDKTLIVAHRRELVTQAFRTCTKTMPGKRIEIELGNKYVASGVADVTVASLRSLLPRLENYSPRSYKLLIIDEAHHAAAESYKKLLTHFAETRVAGFSATLHRSDGKSLEDAMSHIAYHKNVTDLISESWLVDARFSTVSLQVDLSQLPTRGSDFTVTRLSSVINTPKANELVLKTFLRYKQQHSIQHTLVFAVDVAHCESLVSEFRSVGISAEFVSGKTALGKRTQIVEKFSQGEIAVLMNCGVFTEGTDIPVIDSVFIVRPTKSRGLLSQMIGRGLRKSPGKSVCHIVDFVGNSAKDIVTVPELIGAPKRLDIADESFSDMQQRTIEEEQRLEAQREKEREKQALRRLAMSNALFGRAEGMQITSYESLKDLLSENGKMSHMFSGSPYNWIQHPKRAQWAMFANISTYVKVEQAPAGFNVAVYTKNRNYNGYSKTVIKEAASSVAEVDAAVGKYIKDNKVELGSQYWRMTHPTPKQINYLLDQFTKLFDKKYYGPNEQFLSKCRESLQAMTRGALADLCFGKSTFGLVVLEDMATTIFEICESEAAIDDKSDGHGDGEGEGEVNVAGFHN